MSALIAFLVAGMFSAGITRFLLSSELRHRLMDHPNERSLHDLPKPRIGGIGICIGMFLGFSIIVFSTDFMTEGFLFLIGGATIIMIVSFIDDMVALGPAIRFVCQFLSAGILVTGGLVVQELTIASVTLPLPGAFGILFTVLYVVWFTNLYNFMDGMDGLAGGMSAIGFGALALLVVQESFFLLGISLCIAGSSLGFLLYNFPPARVFMGDVGSSTIGFVAAGISLIADSQGVVPLWIFILVFSPFIVDATVTLCRRAVKMERVWRAHKNHYYQKIVQLGWGHKRTVLAEYILMAGCGGSALLAIRSSADAQLMVILFWVVTYLLTIIIVHRMETRTK